MKASTFFAGLLTGAVASAVTVLYSTPKSGSEMRTTVKSASAEWKDQIRDVQWNIDKLKGSFAKLSNKAQEQMPETVEQLKNAIENWDETPDAIKKRLEKELHDIQISLEKLERSIFTND